MALRVPDGYVCAHANKSRIGEFPLNDKKNCLYSPNVIDFAIKKGYYDPASGKPFNFCEAYCPADMQKLRYTETRVWSIFRRVAPSREWPVDYHRGVDGRDALSALDQARQEAHEGGRLRRSCGIITRAPRTT